MHQIVSALFNALVNGVEANDFSIKFKDFAEVPFIITNLQDAIGRQIKRTEIDWPGRIMQIWPYLCPLQIRHIIPYRKITS